MVTVGAYDGMHLIYRVLEKTAGDASGDKFIAAARGMSWMSPRGPVTIDPETRENPERAYSTVTLLARLRGLSTSVPRAQAVW